ncbi:hypothetical protein [Litorivita sp. NS0012-18]|uniref:hypothetical protein n=1 Tax=Litorivita sp. NS0012-18 TaxID=3127655 RepID=UPI00310A965A
MKNVLSVLVIALMSAPEASVADILTVIIDPSALPYEIGPSKYENSPSKYENSSSTYENSDSRYENSPSKYENSPSNYANRVGGGRNLVTEDNKALGYYVFGEGGIINFYNYNSRRIAYLPAGGHTQSVFTDGDWCGTIGEIHGELVLGISQSCYYAFLLQN